MRTKHPAFFAFCCFVSVMAVMVIAWAQDARQRKQRGYDKSTPEPTLTGIRYGAHERHIFDFWKAPSDTLRLSREDGGGVLVEQEK